MATAESHIMALLHASGVAETAFADRPAWLWDVVAGRVLFANAAGVTFLGESRLDALSKRRFDTGGPAMTQLARITETLPADGAPQLAMLRFYVGMRNVALPCVCRLVQLADGDTALLVAATGGDRDRRSVVERAAVVFDECQTPITLTDADGESYRNAAAQAVEHAHAVDTLALPTPHGEAVLSIVSTQATDTAGEDEDSEGDGRHDDGGPDDSGEDIAPARSAELPPHSVPPHGGIGASGVSTTSGGTSDELPRRFTFVLDADGRFLEAGPGLAAAVGERSGDVVGRYWADVAQSLTLDPDGLVAGALVRRDTWSDIVVDWPTDAGGAAQVRLAALPRFGDGRVFVGFKGFADVLAISAPTAEPPSEAGDEDDAGGADDATGTQRPDDMRDTPAADAPAPPETERPNVYHLRPFRPVPVERLALNDQERTAFEQIAEALGARMPGEERPPQSPVEDAAPDAPAPPEQDETSHPEPADRTAGDAEPGADTHDATNPPLDDSDPRDGEAVDAPQEADTGASGEKAEQPARAEPAAAAIAVLDRLPLGVAVVRDEMVLYANRPLLDLFGYSDIDDLEIAGGPSVLFAGPGEQGAVAGRRRDGSDVEVTAQIARVPWGDGQAMLITAAETVRPEEEERPQAEPPADAALAGEAMSGPPVNPDEAAELRAILDTATDGVLVLDSNGHIESMNRSAEALFGIDEQQAVGRPFADLAEDDSKAAVIDYLEGLAAGGVRSVLNDGREVVGLAHRGGRIPLFLTIGRIGEAEPPRFCAVIRDLTDWKAAEAELVDARKRAESANAQKSDFLAKISHEIRTPLNAIIGFAEVILEERLGAIGNDRYRDYVKDIRESGDHIMSLVNDLLDLSKIEAGRLELNFTGVNLNDIVEQSVAIMQPQANRERVIIRTSLARGLPPVVADMRSLRQVMLNLLSNAVKFTPPGGQVIVSTVTGEEGDILLRIRDTGIGMSEADIETALEPFRQLAVRPPTRQQGTGLGLPLTRALVEANRATFTIRSRVNEGTLVEVSFPHSRVLAE